MTGQHRSEKSKTMAKDRTTRSFQKVAFVAYEPWETRVANRFLQTLSEKNNQSESLLLVADPFQIRNKRGSRRLRKLAAEAPHETAVVFRDLIGWQKKIPGMAAAEVDDRLSQIEEAEGIDYLEAVMASDPHLKPRERSPFYGPMTTTEVRAASLLVFERVLEILDDFQPDVVVMMWDQYLVKNFVGALCRARGIPVRVFRRVRFKDYLKLDYFFLPFEGAVNRSLETPTFRRELRDEVAAYGNSLYANNLAVIEASFVHRCRAAPLAAAGEVLKRAWKAQVKKFKTGPLSRPAAYRHLRYWVSLAPRVHLYLLLKAARSLRYIFDRHTLAQPREIPNRFVVVPLHFRPESAILTQGLGIEDDDVVAAVAQRLQEIDPTVTCVVLEHPSMIEDRRYSFYRKLKALGNVVIADPVVPTQDLIRKALGVITISGTVGLEASIAGIPVHVAGYPEFRPAIASQGEQSLADFLEQCAQESGPVSREPVLAYFERHCHDAWRGELGWAAIQSEEALATTVNTLLDMFRASQTETSIG